MPHETAFGVSRGEPRNLGLNDLIPSGLRDQCPTIPNAERVGSAEFYFWPIILCLLAQHYHLLRTKKKLGFLRKVIHLDSKCPSGRRIMGAKVKV
jgi:hypothetical protein